MSIAVEFLDVVKQFPGAVEPAVDHVSFQIQEQEMITILGTSGCGKTTLMKMVNRLYEPTSGEIRIFGENIGQTDAVALRRKIGYVIQQVGLFPHMTVEKNISYGLKNMKVPAKEIKKKVDWAIDILGLSEYRYRKPKNLSGGQRQRVALGRAIVKNQKVFLMDEPLSNLDAKLRVSMRNEISKLHRNLGSTTIYVTHDQVEAMTMADRIVIMKDGVVQQIGKPMDLYEHPVNKWTVKLI